MKRKGTRLLLAVLIGCVATATAYAQVAPCPSYNPAKNTNLACEITTATRAYSVNGQVPSLYGLTPTLASQLSQLPIATAVSGSGLTFSKSLGVFTATSDSLGTILTQRGETLGRHHFMVSFNYQRFSFDTVDGIRLKNLPAVNVLNSGQSQVYIQTNTRVDLRVDQMTALATFGLTSRMDISVIVPFSKVTLSSNTISSCATGLSGSCYNVYVYQNGGLTTTSFQGFSFPGSATGIGDVTLNYKANLYNGERSKFAAGGEVRLPSGDAANYLGTGAYGIKPYIVYSHQGRVTPNFNVAYQWNSGSILNTDPVSGAHLNLPASFMYSGGADIAVNKRLTIAGEFLGQYVINGSRLILSQVTIPSGPTFQTAAPGPKGYSMNNAAVGLKVNPWKGLMLSGSAMIQLDDAGLRTRIVPLVGISYRF